MNCISFSASGEFQGKHTPEEGVNECVCLTLSSAVSRRWDEGKSTLRGRILLLLLFLEKQLFFFLFVPFTQKADVIYRSALKSPGRYTDDLVFFTQMTV